MSDDNHNMESLTENERLWIALGQMTGLVGQYRIEQVVHRVFSLALIAFLYLKVFYWK